VFVARLPRERQRARTASASEPALRAEGEPAPRAHYNSRVRILVIGGTRFIGPAIVRALDGAGHRVAVYHRGRTEVELPAGVEHVHGDRARMAAHASAIRAFAPDAVVDVSAYTERDADISTARCDPDRRFVLISSADVYRAFGVLARLESGAPEPLPITEESAVRSALFPYRARSKGPEDWTHDYEKILVERVVLGRSPVNAVVLRLPAVYGPGDYQHRVGGYLQQMIEGHDEIVIDEGLASFRWTRGYVDDIASAVVLAATRPDVPSRIYNVGESEAPTETEWIHRIGDAVGWTGRIKPVPTEQVPAPTRMAFDWRQELVIDTSRIRRELGYTEQVDRADAMAKTVAWERQALGFGPWAPGSRLGRF
jgi:nucleoside-diphosphate-sugar epimerase